MSDRVHQMRFAETHAAVQEQRIVRHARRFDDRERRRVREVVGLADDEGFERVARIQRQRIQRHLVGGDPHEIPALRGQDQDHVENARLRLAHGGADVVEVVLRHRVFHDVVLRFQNEDLVLHHDRIERIDPAVERYRRDLRADELARFRPDFFEIFHLYFPQSFTDENRTVSASIFFRYYHNRFSPA